MGLFRIILEAAKDGRNIFPSISFHLHFYYALFEGVMNSWDRGMAQVRHCCLDRDRQEGRKGVKPACGRGVAAAVTEPQRGAAS
jgi:predicted aldo/keto reductase-like oxidoreductase